MATKTLVAFQLSSQVKDEAGFAKAADLAGKLSERLRDYVNGSLSAQAVSAGVPTDVSRLMLDEMSDTVARCFARDMMEQIAKIVLELSPPASDAKN